MPRVVITGGAGFIGRPLRSILERGGWDVVSLTRSAADVTDADALLGRVVEAEAVVHLAFPVAAHAQHDRPLETLHEVALGMTNALRFAGRAGAGQVVLASSGKIYGAPVSLPITEDHVLAPSTFLGELKRLQEEILAQGVRYGAAAGWPCGATALRIFNAYGPGQGDGFFVPTLLEGLRLGGPLALGELDHRRDWVHVQDVCEAFLAALARPADPGTLRCLNVGTGRAVSARELLGRLAKHVGGAPEVRRDPTRLRPGEAPEERADCTRLRALGWSPRRSVEEELCALWDAGGGS
ncbi:MAG: NAD(P)-dependent oxidoreductase [bacterium]